MRPGEEPDRPIRVRSPHGEGEGNGIQVGLDVVVADEGGSSVDNFPGVEPVIKAGGGRAEHGGGDVLSEVGEG